AIRPSVLVIVETELWPNLLKATTEFGCKTIMVNARVSDRSFPGYLMIRPFMRLVLENITRICAQSSIDAERFKELGARSDRITVTGNLKFDGRTPQFGIIGRKLQTFLEDSGRKPVFVAASTMRGEESLVLKAWENIHGRYPQSLMILAPRHPARFDEVAKNLEALQLSIVRRTGLSENADEICQQMSAAEVLLLDTIGELAEVVGVADVVFVGGSLVPTGGHNVIEPAFWAKPIVFGPHMYNFRDVASIFLRAGGAVQVADAHELTGAVLHLLNHPADARQMGEKAKAVVNEQAGAARRILIQMEEWLGTPQATIAPLA
ncbi:MAG TPA: glycosyltransferase N-terminal domain-containing protein, partial [Terriglobia bacterium]|nr:glycosyltransferase N-terminal domain-containing protein [Terriglobia bacterium]